VSISVDACIALGIALGLFLTYQLSGGVPVAEDYPNLRVAEAICRRGAITLTPAELPALFRWQLQHDGRQTPVEVSWYDAEVAATQARGELVLTGSRDLLLPTRHPGRYGNCFGLGPSLAAVPVLAVAGWLVGPLDEHLDWLFWAGKLTAAAYVAASAAVIFLIVRRFCRVAPAVLIALLYGLGTCAWSVSSQSLWQHAPNQFFLAIACYGLCRLRDYSAYAVLAGAALGAAAWCRPTSGLFVLTTVAYLLWTNRPALVGLLAGGLPFAVGMAAYNLYLYGDLVVLGQARVVVAAVERTGSSNMWQTPLWLGAWGKLLSPSRGLFVFSPFLVFAALGAWRVWRDATYEPLRALTLGVLAIWGVEFHFFDWWAGWSFGYRHLVDTVVLLVLLLVPVMPTLARRPLAAGLFSCAALYSIAVQALGVWTYDGTGWNNREAFVIRAPDAQHRTVFDDPVASNDWPPPVGSQIEHVNLDIDFGENRRRLWSWRDSQLVYYATHFREARAKRLVLSAFLTRPPVDRRVETYVSLGNAWAELKSLERAARMFGLALDLNPIDHDALLGAARLRTAGGHPGEAVVLLQQALDREPNNLQFLAALALTWQMAGHHAEAVAAAAEARKVHPIYAHEIFHDQVKLWHKQVEPWLNEQQRTALVAIEKELSANWFYNSR
jgi:hypothetical protein